MNDSKQFIQVYRQEAEELLADIEEAVLDIEEDPEDKEVLNRLFRAMHTIKGSGAMFGYNDISEFTHHIESVLDKVRAGILPVTRGLIDLVLSSRDHILTMLDAADSGEAIDREEGERIVNALKDLLPDHDGDELNPSNDIKAPLREEEEKNVVTYRIRFKPNPGIFLSGMNPALLLDELCGLGECSVKAITDDIPCLNDLSPETCYIYWDITLTTLKKINAIKDVFIFVEDESDIRIDILEGPIPEDVENPVQRIGEILVDRGDVRPENISGALKEQRKIGEILVGSGAVSNDKLESALNEQQILQKNKNTAKLETVRVPSERLDKLVNLVGELVTTQARLTQVATEFDNTELATPVEDVERLTGELRDNVLNIRMMPIGSTFSKFRRLVRDLSADLKKDIELITEGAETELDKTIIERINEPLVHLIRNSIDHGIERPEDRKIAGKDIRGMIRLSAEHKGANVVISIEDDGVGLDKDVIRAKAVEKGLLDREAELPEKEIFNLVFSPGFSTSNKVTNVSGRGVGMDVVKRTIESLRGSIDIDSERGKGTSMTLKLPLTLAIINGLLVSIGDAFYVLPLMSVEECAELTDKDLEKAHGSNILKVRDEIVPFVRIRDHFDIMEERPAKEHIVIADVNEKRIGFVVDNVLGGHQTVIKSMGPAFKHIRDVSGATILGDGTVALILDVNTLVNGS